MSLLIIDNYDSFVFNLARYTHKLGFQSQVVRNDAISLSEIDALNPRHIILSPGPCTPNEAGICLALLDRFAGRIPILGICLGHQAIGQALGATIVRARKPMHGKASLIQHNRSGLFHHLNEPFLAGRYHSLVIDPQTLPNCLQVNAWSAENEIMAISYASKRLFGLQFHPESVLTPVGLSLLQAFLLPPH